MERALRERDRLRGQLAVRALESHRVQVMETTEGRISVTLDLSVDVAAFVAHRLAALVYEPSPGTLLASQDTGLVGVVTRRESPQSVRMRGVLDPRREWSHWLTDLRPVRLGEVLSLTGKVHRPTP
ncbi:hypothetical protein D7319_30775 [Streptomyces radicis]|uniref:Uncharacterized protein n=1 Tax=Streptomyces radicis TaxID=1750517 RepID=A0A3A9W3J6_9ACTN|nr:hypothetical protein D7319_30775 [Streptomyces radicis]RKN13845.1 hypothetical protein D7318_30315 [Streptomyces radicis]